MFIKCKKKFKKFPFSNKNTLRRPYFYAVIGTPDPTLPAGYKGTGSQDRIQIYGQNLIFLGINKNLY